MEPPVFRDQKGPLVLPVLRDQQDHKASKDLQEAVTLHRDLQDQPVLQDRTAQQVSQGLRDLRDQRALKECQVLRVKSDQPVLKVLKGLQAKQDPQGQPVKSDQQDLQALAVAVREMVTQQPDHQDQPDHQARRVKLEPLGQPVNRDPQVLTDRTALKAYRVKSDQQDLRV